MQELKSTQPQLPAAVATALKACGWLDEDGKSAHGPVFDANAAADPQTAFAIPGLTITSFHLQMLRTSMLVHCMMQWYDLHSQIVC